MKHLSPSMQRGVSLIEALLSMLILALGIMGMAGIQTHTLLESRATNARSVAVQLADDLLDRMQANSSLEVTRSAANPYLVAWGSAPTPTIDCVTAACNASQLAAYDLSQWKASLARTLPAGDAQIFQSTTDTTQIGVLIGWRETLAKNQAQAKDDEATLYADAIASRNAVNAIGTGVTGVDCPSGHICHLVYIRP